MTTVILFDELFDHLAACRLIPAGRHEALRREWQQGSPGPSANLDALAAWLVARGALTEYQAGVVSRGNARQLLLGPYVIQERVGRGRMAGVYRAVHESGVTVAIKVLPPSKAAQPIILKRFQREARAAMRVIHPNVVRAFHTGEHAGLHYLVMELLEGKTLHDVLNRRDRLSVEEAARVAHQALLGLQAIHEQGLLHRDVRPANLTVVGGTKDDLSGAVVKVLDLGAVRAASGEEAALSFDLTRPGEMIGDAEYMSPEQARDPKQVDARSDLYSLGCVLYHMLAGDSPFADRSPVQQLLRHATEAPRPLKGVPAGLERVVVRRLMAKAPAERPATAADAAALLLPFVQSGSSGKRPPGESVAMAEFLGWVDSLDGHSAGSDSVLPAEVLPGSPSVEWAEVVPTTDENADEERPRQRRNRQRDEEEEADKDGPGWSQQQLVVVGVASGLGVLALGLLGWIVYILVQ